MSFAQRVWFELAERIATEKDEIVFVAIISAALKRQREAARTAAAKAIAVWATNDALGVKQRTLADVVASAILNAEMTK